MTGVVGRGESTVAPGNTSDSQPGRGEQEISIPLKELIKQYWQENETAKAWSERTKTEYERGLNHLVLSFFGDVPVNTIDYEVGRAFKKHLMGLPKRFNVLPWYNDVPFLELPAVREQQNDEPISSKTVNKYLGIAQGLFTYAVQHKYLKINPLSGLMIKETRRADEIRDPFTREDLEKLFLSEEYQSSGHAKPYQFWLPVLALYTGCRVEELCQLYVKDVTQIDGIWVLDINDDAPDKSVKTHERRLVPLHPFLTGELRFHVYAASKRGGRVFPELKRIKNRYSHYVSSNWFYRYKKKCGIQAESGNKTFHSFRHTVADYLKQNYDLPDHFISELLGHRNPNITTGRYGKRFDPKTLLEKAVMKLDYYGIDLSHLKSSKWVPRGE